MKHSDSASVSAARVLWIYKGDVNSILGESCEEPSSSTESTKASFNDDNNNNNNNNNNKENLNVNKFCSQ